MFRSHRTTIVFALLGGAVAAVVTWVGSLTLGILAGLATWAIAMVALAWAERNGALGPDDPSRRRVLLWGGLGGLAWVVAQRAPQRADGLGERAVRDDDVAPDFVEDLAAGHNRRAPVDEQDEQIEVPWNQREGDAQSRHLPPLPRHDETGKAIALGARHPALLCTGARLARGQRLGSSPSPITAPDGRPSGRSPPLVNAPRSGRRRCGGASSTERVGRGTRR